MTTATLNSIQIDFKKYVNDRMSLIEKSLEHLSSSLDQALEYSYSYNIKLAGIPEVKQREGADETL